MGALVAVAFVVLLERIVGGAFPLVPMVAAATSATLAAVIVKRVPLAAGSGIQPGPAPLTP